MTVCQAREAADALLDALPLAEQDQGMRLAKAARGLQRTQHRNAASRASHTKARLQLLRDKGIRIETLHCRRPP